MSSWGLTTYTSCQVAPTDYTSLYVYGLTHLGVWVHRPPTVNWNLTLEFLHDSVFRVIKPIRRYTSARKGACRFLLLVFEKMTNISVPKFSMS